MFNNKSKTYSEIPEKQRRIIQECFGSPSMVLRVEEEAKTPQPQEGEIVVRMNMRAINPSDIVTIRGAYSHRTSLPRVPGYEGVGIVVSHGRGVEEPEIGSRVLALRGAGTWQEYVTVPAEEAILVPDNVDDKSACQLYINPLTAWVMLTQEIRPQKGDVIVANAAGSAFGRILAQLSQILNFRFIAVTRSDKYTDILLKLGAEVVINSSKEDILEKVKLVTNGEGAKVALDAVGGESGGELAQSVGAGGRLLIYGLLSGMQIDSRVLFLAQERNVCINNFWLSEWVYSQPIEERRQVFNELIALVAEGKIQLSDIEEYPLEQVKTAIIAAEKNSNRDYKVALRSF